MGGATVTDSLVSDATTTGSTCTVLLISKCAQQHRQSSPEDESWCDRCVKAPASAHVSGEQNAQPKISSAAIMSTTAAAEPANRRIRTIRA